MLYIIIFSLLSIVAGSVGLGIYVVKELKEARSDSLEAFNKLMAVREQKAQADAALFREQENNASLNTALTAKQAEVDAQLAARKSLEIKYDALLKEFAHSGGDLSGAITRSLQSLPGTAPTTTK